MIKNRPLRGFFLYALEIMEKGKDYEILHTNLQPFFWRKVKNIIRQNQKVALLEFLFGGEVTRMEKDDNRKTGNKGLNPTIQILEDQIQSLHNKIDSFQQKVSKKDDTVDQMFIATKTIQGKDSIFVEFAHSKLNCYDKITNQLIKTEIMVEAHSTCMQKIAELPRRIVKKDKNIKFGKNYKNLFKENYQIFGYNLYLEENLSKTASQNQINKAKNKLFKKYKKISKKYLRENLFKNPYIIKLENCHYLDNSNFVTIYFDELKDIFAIIDSKSNSLLDFGIANKINYSEIFVYKSVGRVNLKDICLHANQQSKDKDSQVPTNLKSLQSKQLEDLKSLKSKQLEDLQYLESKQLEISQ